MGIQSLTAAVFFLTLVIGLDAYQRSNERLIPLERGASMAMLMQLRANTTTAAAGAATDAFEATLNALKEAHAANVQAIAARSAAKTKLVAAEAAVKVSGTKLAADTKHLTTLQGTTANATQHQASLKANITKLEGELAALRKKEHDMQTALHTMQEKESHHSAVDTTAKDAVKAANTTLLASTAAHKENQAKLKTANETHVTAVAKAVATSKAEHDAVAAVMKALNDAQAALEQSATQTEHEQAQQVEAQATAEVSHVTAAATQEAQAAATIEQQEEQAANAS